MNSNESKRTGLERIKEEYRDLSLNPITNIGTIVNLPDQNNYYEWIFTLVGPKDTSYAGGLFILKIKFPKDYPQKPPQIYFITPVYHLNVNPKVPQSELDNPLGYVSISTLNWWKPDYTIREVITNIFALFYMQNPDSCFSLEQANEFRNNRKVYEEKVIFFTKKYATHQSNNSNWDFSFP